MNKQYKLKDKKKTESCFSIRFPNQQLKSTTNISLVFSFSVPFDKSNHLYFPIKNTSPDTQDFIRTTTTEPNPFKQKTVPHSFYDKCTDFVLQWINTYSYLARKLFLFGIQNRKQIGNKSRIK